MLTPDTINGAFEACGAILTWKNFATYCREREVKGIYWPGHAFWASWGVWNLFYYTSLNQPLSFLGGIALTSGTAAWLAFVAFDAWMRRVDRSIDAWFDDLDEAVAHVMTPNPLYDELKFKPSSDRPR